MQSSEVLYLHFGGGGVGAGGTESNIKALSTSLAVYARKATAVVRMSAKVKMKSFAISSVPAQRSGAHS